MNFVKFLAIFVLILVAIFVGIILINHFLPNPYTASIYTFITVTAPAYIMSKFEWILLSIGGIVTAAGAAIKSINKTKDQADEKVKHAQDEATQAKDFASNQFGEVQKLTDEKKALEDQIKGMEQSRTEAEQLVSQQKFEITVLKGQNQQLMDKLASAPAKTIVEVR